MRRTRVISGLLVALFAVTTTISVLPGKVFAGAGTAAGDNGKIIIKTDTNLYSINPDGTGAQSLKSFSSTGNVFFDVTDDGRLMLERVSMGSGYVNELRIVNTFGETVKTIGSLGTQSNDVSFSTSFFSPDGNYVVYSSFDLTNNTSSVNLYNRNTEAITPIMQTSGGTAYVDLVDISNNADKVLVTYRDGGASQPRIYSRGSGTTYTHTQTYGIPGGTPRSRALALSPDSSKVLYGQGSRTTDTTRNYYSLHVTPINAVDPNDALNLTVFRDRPNTCTGSGCYIDVDFMRGGFSPDGTKVFGTYSHGYLGGSFFDYLNQTVVLDASQPSSQTPVYVGDAGGSGYKRESVFSPDQSKILYFDPSGVIRHSSATTTGQGNQDLTSGISGNNPHAVAWLRDGPTLTKGSGIAVNALIPSNKDFSDQEWIVYNNETLTNNGTIGSVTVKSGGTLKGTDGAIGFLTVEGGGTVAPGNSPGCIASADTTYASGSTLQIEIGGTVKCTGYDSHLIAGTINLGNATLQTNILNGFKPSIGTSFVIVDNDGSDAVVGTFNGLAQGATFTQDGVQYTISYTGNDGNDVTLTVSGGNPGAVNPAGTPSTPGTPRTGLASILANPVLTLGATTLSAGGLYALSRKYRVFA